ncbi:MAG: transposase, partial [bacterium]|nr:transposase [bacterium]
MKGMKFIQTISEEEKTPLVISLLEMIQYQNEQIQLLRDEIARLKDHKPKPRPKPSNLDKKTEMKKRGKKKKRKKKPKTANLEIHEEVIIEPETEPPSGSEFKGYEDYVVQELIVSNHNTVYRRERWKTPSGGYVVGQLPDEISGHFGPTLVSFILFQYYSCHVTQPLIYEQLREYGVDISTGQVSNIIVKNKDMFHREKAQILTVGLRLSGHVNVDDTGAVHQGKSGFCTHIGNEWFAWFESTESKSRINFLELLRSGHTDYVLSDDALEYMAVRGLPAFQLSKLDANIGMTFEDADQWLFCLKTL